MMRRWFASMHSFADKVTWLVTLTSGVAILAVCFTLVGADYLNMRRETLAGLQTHMMIVAMNSGAPLAFDDRRSANEALSAFQTRAAVARAELYDVGGNLFASYQRPEATGEPSAGLAKPDASATGLRMQRTAVEEQGQRLGTLQVFYDLDELQSHLWQTLGLSTLVALIAVLMVYLFSLRIRGTLIRPIELLGQTARRISQTRDYAQRAPKVSDDELGAFTETFNQMLAQIQKQDAEIQASRAEALNASQLKDEFLATLSHELRTPMAPILGWAQILRLNGGGNAQVLQASAVIERNARAQNKIVDDLLDMSRIVSGKLKLEVHTMDLADAVHAAIETVAAAATAKSIALEQDIEPGLAIVHGDPHRLQQVAWNLMSNAIKFTGSGGRVRVTLGRHSAQAVLSVVDTGQGITAEFLPHIFERFRQADSSITRHHGGLGLGLSIARQLVELHGGDISAASAGVNQGSTFTVTLPIAPGDLPRRESGSEIPPPADARGRRSLHGCKVLLVEDEQDARELVEGILRLAGAIVLAVDSAAAAMRVFDPFQPDVLLSDIGMSGASGYDLIRQLRASSSVAMRDVPAIALTAFARPEDRARAREAGFQQHLSKPIDNDALIAAVLGSARNAP
ncbi:MAG TPA: ATP-binding protein [Rudaea sp.]|jgi:signal transduction histidine kinase/ActR/RegA family two-component response regulator|nr:ATP-binding protein [Rudaea sp.]